MIIRVRYQGDRISEIADWLADHAGGPIEKLQHGGLGGPGWTIYHVSEMVKISENPDPLPFLITKADIRDPEIAIMFKLRWS